MREVAVARARWAGYPELFGRADELVATAARLRRTLAGRTLWHVNSTSDGGGVAELLRATLPLLRSAGLRARWVVIDGDERMFAITKRLCLNLYGSPGDGGPLGPAEEAHFARVNAENAAGWAEQLEPGDIVVVHDPQPAALIGAAARRGAHVVWRCHIGSDKPTGESERGWAFLRPHVEGARAMVFSTPRHVPGWLPPGTATVIPPAIDPRSRRNVELDPRSVRAILTGAGLLAGADLLAGAGLLAGGPGPADVPASDPATVLRYGPAPRPEQPMVLQVSRWDRLKDMAGVLEAFCSVSDNHPDAYLTLAGPAVDSVSDDPEAAGVFAECVRRWRALPERLRGRSQLACLPMADRGRNATMVNALQRHATVVVQKSLAEGFGLTATEAMWKARPLIVSAVGGLADQVIDGESGVTLADPGDLVAAGAAIERLLAAPEQARRLGDRARHRVREHYLQDRLLLDWAALLTSLMEEG